MEDTWHDHARNADVLARWVGAGPVFRSDTRDHGSISQHVGSKGHIAVALAIVRSTDMEQNLVIREEVIEGSGPVYVFLVSFVIVSDTNIADDQIGRASCRERV